MGGIIRKTILSIIVSFGAVIFISGSTKAQTVVPVESPDPAFLITELKVSPSTEEFIEFTNNTNQELEISSVKLEYHSDTSTTYSNKTLTFKKTLPLPMPAGSKLQFSSASSTWVNDSLATFSAGLKDSVGWIKLSVVVGDTAYSSSAQWGIKDEPDCTTSPAPSSTQSLKRFVNSESIYLLSEKAGEDYFLSSTPTPLDQLNPEPLNPDEVDDYCNKPALPTVDPPPTITVTPNITTPTQPTISPTTTTPPEAQTKSYLPIQITEILADPVSPQTDAEDEYIEIYNPNVETVNLIGYKLESGSNFSYSYTFGDQEIGSGQYLVIYHKDSGLTLSNTAGAARIIDPAGTVLDQTSYQDPEPASSWSKINGAWVYTSSQTPGAENVYLAPVVKSSLTTKTTSKVKTTKATSVKKAAAVKSASKKAAPAAKKPKTTSKTTSNQTNLNSDEPELTKLNSKYIYIAIIVLALYNLWEYRLSIQRFLMKPILKRELKNEI
jgi:hypothetical protein